MKALRSNFDVFVNSESSNRSSKNGRKLIALTERAEAEFRRYMDNDFDTPIALTALMNLSNRLRVYVKPSMTADEESKQKAASIFRKMAEVFGILS